MVLRKGDRLHYTVGFHGLVRGVAYPLAHCRFRRLGRHYGKSAYTSRLRLTDRGIPTQCRMYISCACRRFGCGPTDVTRLWTYVNETSGALTCYNFHSNSHIIAFFLVLSISSGALTCYNFHSNSHIIAFFLV